MTGEHPSADSIAGLEDYYPDPALPKKRSRGEAGCAGTDDCDVRSDRSFHGHFAQSCKKKPPNEKLRGF
jgi:hypothetical protein